MRTRNSWTALALAAALLSGGAGAAGAQERRPADQGQADRRQRVEQEFIFTRQHPETGARVPVEPDIHGRGPLPGDTFVYLATEMSFDGKLVKGAPYSAEAVTESVQVLTDGNRIARRNTVQVYRDSEGRTRREHTLATLGPWATADEPTRTVSIHDPVAGFSYSLDPRSRTARKVKQMVRRAPVSGLSFESGKLEVVPFDGKPINVADVKSTLPGRVVGRADAAHPAAAPDARGTVIVKIKVNAAGAVESAEPLRRTENNALREAALDAARRWSFRPGEAETAAVSYKFDGRAAVAGELLKVFETTRSDSKAGKKTEEHRVMILSGDAPNVETESLGKQVIEGVEAEGTRTVRTIPAGQIGNEQPIQIVHERWYSPELQVVVMTRSSDPRSGETTYRLTNISRAEPAATLFQVPSDYTVKDAPVPFVRGLKHPPAPPQAPLPPMMD
ncbi:MAG TPA: energy transducer TonB [Pyrinomonadaceae bacterium]|nr:energy transducer TonB [Pyrinomonadaceae bacterium]